MRMRFAVATATLGALLAFSGSDVQASSHREAPFITKNPKVDATDFYMFNSYEAGRGAFVTIIANYQPLQAAYGGPNYFTMDQEALYEIHVDNTGDAVEDLTFQFRFKNALNDATGDVGIALPITGDAGVKTNSIPLANANVLGGAQGGTSPLTTTNAGAALNVLETYSVKLVTGPRRTGTAADVTAATGGATTFKKPFDYIGKKAFAGDGATAAAGLAAYQTYANQHIYPVTIPGCATPGSKIFVGQRHESFKVNLGVIFDNVDAPLGVITNAANRDAAQSVIDGTNITTIAMEIPAACLTKAPETVIGGWTSASVRQARVINPSPSFSKPVKEGGAWAQVSRLGMPLVNEVVIGIKDKDKFNSSEPKDDGQFADYVTNPVLPKYLTLLFGSANVPDVPITRTDLVTVFLTGVPGVNKFGGSPVVSEMLRLNTGLPATPATTTRNSPAPANQTNLGAALCFPNNAATGGSFTPVLSNPGCDAAGFPNGRRPGDDIVDIELTTVLGYFLPKSQAGASGVILHDAVLQDATDFDSAFPYLKAPNPGS